MIISRFKSLHKILACMGLLMLGNMNAYAEGNAAQSLKMWSMILEKPERFNPHQLISFLNTHTHWPQFKKLCARAEKIIAGQGTTQQIRVWFDDHPPQTPTGVMMYAAILSKEEAKELIRSAWKTMEMTAREEQKFIAQYKDVLSQKDHAARMNHALWNEDIEGAKRLFPYVSAPAKQTAVMRIAFIKKKAPPLKTAQDEGLLYEIVRDHKENKRWSHATKILTSTNSSRMYAPQWWKMRSYVARELIQMKQFAKAYQVLKKHNLEPGSKEYAEAKWLQGWLALQFLGKPVEAQHHFETLVDNVKSAISKSRTMYWLARSFEAQKKFKTAKVWYTKSAYYKTTFYGQLSAHKIHQNPYPVLHDAPRVTDKDKQKFQAWDLVKAACLLKGCSGKAEDDLAKILTCIASQAKTRAERELAVHLAHQLAPHMVVWIARKAGHEEPVLLKIAYPRCTLPHRKGLPEKELLYAMARRESDFNPKALSSKGAMGLLQLISSTAAKHAKELGIAHSDAKLFVPSHNLLLGSVHVASLVDKFNTYVLVTAAYNAGPTPVGRWCKDFGRPHESNIDIVDWIELIPYSETRAYVMGVLADLNNYRTFTGSKRKTLIDDLKKCGV